MTEWFANFSGAEKVFALVIILFVIKIFFVLLFWYFIKKQQKQLNDIQALLATKAAVEQIASALNATESIKAIKELMEERLQHAELEVGSAKEKARHAEIITNDIKEAVAQKMARQKEESEKHHKEVMAKIEELSRIITSILPV